jgi:hypothetical protein
MKLLIAMATAWIAFAAFDQLAYGGRLVPALPGIARSIAAGFGFSF